MNIMTRGSKVPAVVRPLVAAARRRAYGFDGANGCCRCGGPTYNWAYWGATDGRLAETFPDLSLKDWSQCDACHEADPMAELPSLRLSDAERDGAWAEFLAGRHW